MMASKDVDCNSDDDHDYDIQEGLAAVSNAMSRVNGGVSLNQLRNGGAEFEVKTLSHAETDELKDDKDETEHGWWTEEQLERQLEEQKLNPIFITDADGDKVVDFNHLKKDMKILFTNPSGKPLVWKSVISHGHGDKVTDDSTVGYDAVMYLNGTNEPFDSSVMRKRPFLNRLNSELIVPGLRFALTTMRVGEEALVIVDPDVAFGALGCQPRISGNAEILYQLSIKRVYQEGSINNFLTMSSQDQAAYSFEQVLKMANDERISGNSYFKQDRKREAGIRYKRAIIVLENRLCISRDEEKKAQDILIKLYTNAANSSLCLNRPYAAMMYSRKALEIDKNCAKALYFYGKAKLSTGDYEDSLRYLSQASAIKPDNEEIVKALKTLNQRMHESKKISDDLARQMAKAFIK